MSCLNAESFLSSSLTFVLAPAELDSSQVNQVHAVQVVVYEELQQVGNVALVGLVTFAHHCSALQQLAHPATNRGYSIIIYICCWVKKMLAD